MDDRNKLANNRREFVRVQNVSREEAGRMIDLIPLGYKEEREFWREWFSGQMERLPPDYPLILPADFGRGPGI